mmetsp:Transcript_5477/g.7923  ORF Transcript_5477/g.7923 Transcript_5477/m.7923 type:complete len:1130 (-) Transcript_5477:15-3404(-)
MKSIILSAKKKKNGAVRDSKDPMMSVLQNMKSEQFASAMGPFREDDNNSSKSMSFKEKMIQHQMKKYAAKKMRGPFPELSENENQVQQLQLEKEMLSSRCRKLEAQNFIGSAEILDVLALILGTVSWILTYFLYGMTVWWSLDNCEHFYVWIIKIFLLTFPFIFDKINYGVINRRFQVFAVFVLFLIRVKLARWRVSKFASEENTEAEELPSLPDDSGSTPNFGDSITADDIWEANYEVNARFLFCGILRLRGLWTKTAQYMSSRADFVPAAYVRELSKLQDQAPETAWADVQKMLKKAGVFEKFYHVEQKPIASASIAQVHIARLKETNDDVVIKVQHPSALTLLSDDFVSLRIMAWITGILEPEYKFIGILLKEWANEAQKELDFMSEVENLETARSAIQNMSRSTPMMADHNSEQVPFSVEIPRPLKAVSSKRVMVMTFSEGKRIDDLAQIRKCDVSKEHVMNALAQTTAYMMYASDIFNGDPHAGNLFIRPGLLSNGKGPSEEVEKKGFTIVLLDWGLAKRLPESKRAGFCQIAYAAATVDFALMLDGFNTLGLKLKRENVAEDMEGMRFLLRDMVPRETARKRIKAKMKTDMGRIENKKRGERIPVDSNAYPGEFFFFVRTNELLHGLGSKLGIEMTYLDVLKPYAEMGLKELNNYVSVSKVPDPIATEKVDNPKLKKKIDDILCSLQESGKIAGAQVCVVKDDIVLSNNVIGNLGSFKSHIPVRSDSIMVGFSITKATAATLANRMVEEGYMKLDEPICEKIWPEFCPTVSPPAELLDSFENDDEKDNARRKWQWKRSITLRHILTHTSGLWFATPKSLTIQNYSCEKCAQGFEYRPDKPEETILPTSKPGTDCEYHYLSFGWLVAGCVIGAYFNRHNKKRLAYEDIYNKILGEIHSPSLLNAGFKPCGGGGSEHDIAFVETEIFLIRAMQMKREAEAMGEIVEAMKEQQGEDNKNEQPPSTRKLFMQGIKGREFILDPRYWNSKYALDANVPSAGGRFSAKALAMFYQELGNGKILGHNVLSEATTVSASQSNNLREQLGQSSSIVNGNVNKGKTEFGLGYQIIRIDNAKNNFAFGHPGVGGSIGFHHVSSNSSIGIMVNKIDIGMESTNDIINVISRHLKW